jgi:hypothetical protein
MKTELNKELCLIKERLRAKMDGPHSPLYKSFDELTLTICKIIDVLRKMTGESFEEECEDAAKPEVCLFCNKPTELGPVKLPVPKEDHGIRPFGRGAY